MSQIKLVRDIVKAIGKQKKTIRTSTLNIILESVNRIIAEEVRELKLAFPGMGLRAWLESDDTGLSSRYMAHVLCSGPAADCFHPLDSDDFGRCYRFLRAVFLPGTELENAQKMSGKSKEWTILAKKWPELEIVFEIGKGKGLSQMIALILGEK